MVLSYARQILNAPKFDTQLRAQAFGTLYDFFVQDSQLQIHFTEELSSEAQSACDSFVQNFVDYETVDQLSDYLDNEVEPFVKKIVREFAAENISLGITQSGKTAEVLGLFQKLVPVGSGNPVSLKGCLDTGSLYVAIAVLQYFRDNTSEYTGLSPYVTDARLLSMKNQIESFLGVALSS